MTASDGSSEGSTGTQAGPDTDLRLLLDLVERLRAPDGCPWDREQRLSDVRAYLLEEAHELAAAVDRASDTGEWTEIHEEAGDLLFQMAFLLRLAEEQGALDAGDVVRSVHAKMVARHPHVFGEPDERRTPGGEPLDAAAVTRRWEARKAEERSGDGALLDGVAPTLPALLATYRLSQKAAGVGFDWPTEEAVLEKVDEELAEIREALETETGERRKDRLTEEVGDLLFTVGNLARKLGFDPEAALAGANRKFRRRFQHVERGLRERGRALGDAPLEELEELWGEAKADDDAG